MLTVISGILSASAGVLWFIRQGAGLKVQDSRFKIQN
jgi:hypothetical protein